jgi:16S rRNA processing protein RimM
MTGRVGDVPHPPAAPLSAPGASAAGMPADAVEVGRIIGPWGVKGEIRVKPFSADAGVLFSSTQWFLQANDQPRPPGAKPLQTLPAELQVQRARDQGDSVVAAVQGLSDRDQALALSGARVFVSRASFPATRDDDEFYWVDLIGLAVVNRTGLALGSVIGLIETGPHSVLRIQSPQEGAQECLIPFVAAYVDQVDNAARVITVDWEADY